jgi:hypothetical protein
MMTKTKKTVAEKKSMTDRRACLYLDLWLGKHAIEVIFKANRFFYLNNHQYQSTSI